jgi:hypothetical protein
MGKIAAPICGGAPTSSWACRLYDCYRSVTVVGVDSSIMLLSVGCLRNMGLVQARQKRVRLFRPFEAATVVSELR